MMTATTQRSALDAAPLQVRVQGPDAPPPTPAELRRLFAGRSLSRARRDRLALTPRVLAVHAGRIVGLAAFERAHEEVRVYELAVDAGLCFGAHEIVRQLLDALELSCLAGDCRRLVLLPAAVVATGRLERLGYRLVAEGCAGGWLEKSFR
jgi:hypothetical protein